MIQHSLKIFITPSYDSIDYMNCIMCLQNNLYYTTYMSTSKCFTLCSPTWFCDFEKRI